jgi:hypothetical protein
VPSSQQEVPQPPLRYMRPAERLERTRILRSSRSGGADASHSAESVEAELNRIILVERCADVPAEPVSPTPVPQQRTGGENLANDERVHSSASAADSSSGVCAIRSSRSAACGTVEGAGQAPCFMFSGTYVNFEALERTLTELSVRVQSRQRHVDEHTTHVVIADMHAQISHKYYSALAGGKYLVKPSYVAACGAAGALLPLGEHEWKPKSGRRTAAGTWSKDPSEQRLVAYQYWRERRRAGQRAFAQWSAAIIIVSSEQRADHTYESILKLGGAHAYTLQLRELTVDKLEELGITHAIANEELFDPKSVCLSYLHRKQRLYSKHMIQEYLLCCGDIDMQSYRPAVLCKRSLSLRRQPPRRKRSNTTTNAGSSSSTCVTTAKR